MATHPLITTIIPTYRRPALLCRAIRSVLAQSFPDFQMCVYDNASGDNTAATVVALRTVDRRIQYFQHARNIGSANNFNFGLARVDTEFFSFLSDDDILLPAFYETALASFKAHPDAMFSATEVAYVDERGRVIGHSNSGWKEGYFSPPAGLLAMLHGGHHPPTWTGILFRRKVIQEVGLLDREIDVGFDYDFLQRIAARFPFVLSNGVGALYVYEASSVSASCRLNSFWPGGLKVIANVADDARIPLRARIEAKRFLIDALKKTVFIYGRKAIKRGDPEEALMASKILKDHFHATGASMLLYWTAVCCRKFPVTHRLLTLASRLRPKRGEPKGDVDYSAYMQPES